MGNTISYEQKHTTLDLGEKGSIRGVQFDNKAYRYTGIPYALPPTGQHRWRKPRQLPANYVYGHGPGKPLDATKFKPICPQKAFHVVNAEGGSDVFNEDCLMVNIWTPVGDEKKGTWPVMLWLHGGWFQMGDPSQEPVMDPTELISTGGMNAIVVAIGYRLNIFGFLAAQDLVTESNGASGGNFGLWDQRMAAEWVKENISLFGGDPNNITLAGRSAGAYSVEAQMCFDFRKPGPKSSVYQRAFMDSNAIPAQPKSLKDTQAQFDELCTYFNVDQSWPAEKKLETLRGIEAKDLVAAIPKLKHHTFRPVTDDLFIFSGMIEYLQSKEFADEFKSRKYKLLIGEVANEETLYSTYNSPTSPTIQELKLQIENYYAPEVTERVLECYPLPTSDDLSLWKNLFGHIISDGQVRAPSRALVMHMERNGVSVQDLWRYQIAYRLSFIDEKVAPMSFGVAHAMDKPFWNFSIQLGPTDEERKLMEGWIRILVAFVHNDESYQYGTSVIQEMKVVTPEGKIEVQRDQRWDELLKIGSMFSGGKL